MGMVQSLWNTIATPNISDSSLTTTAPSILQGTHSMFPDLVHCWFSSRSLLRCLIAPSLPPCPSCLTEEQGEMVCTQSLAVLSYSQDLGSTCTLEARLQTAMTTVCPTLWTQPEDCSKMEKTTGSSTVNALVNSLLVSMQTFVSGT